MATGTKRTRKTSATPDAAPAPAPARAKNATIAKLARALASTKAPYRGQRLRVTADREESLFGAKLTVIEPPPSAEQDWRNSRLDALTLERADPTRLTELLVDLAPDVNRAHFDWLRELNPGWTLETFVPGTETPDTRAQASVDAFMKLLGRLYGSPDVTLNRMFTGTFMRGAVFCELVMDTDRRTAIDFATPDPYLVRFRKTPDAKRGVYHEPGVMRSGQWVSFDLPTIRYIPLDPMPGVPYGRAMVTSALFTSVFLLGMLHDLRRVIAQQGYPRPDIEIDLETLANEMPADLEEDADAKAQWIDQVVDAVATYYAQLQPDDAYVHTSVVKLNKPVGTVDTDSLGGISAIIEALERMSVRALKTCPFMMAVSESNTETQANRQWEAHLQGVKSVQHLVESAMEQLLEFKLQAEGILADVRFRFAVNRKGDELRDALAESQRIQNERDKLAAGWTEQNEASNNITEHDASEAEPRDGAWAQEDPNAAPDPQTTDGADGEDTGDDNADSGRSRLQQLFRGHLEGCQDCDDCLVETAGERTVDQAEQSRRLVELYQDHLADCDDCAQCVMADRTRPAPEIGRNMDDQPEVEPSKNGHHPW